MDTEGEAMSAGKEIMLERAKILTPWLTASEAAIYCGIHRNTFDRFAGGIPHGGTGKHRRFHKDVLDKWINNEIGGCPFDSPIEKSAGGRGVPPKRPSARHVLYDPGTGKTYGEGNRRAGESEKRRKGNARTPEPQ
jgi:excisionase family DNA binding protein